MRDGRCDWLENVNLANGARSDVRALLPQALLPSGWRSRMQREVVFDPFPVSNCRARAVNARGIHFGKSCNGTARSNFPLSRVA